MTPAKEATMIMITIAIGILSMFGGVALIELNRQADTEYQYEDWGNGASGWSSVYELVLDVDASYSAEPGECEFDECWHVMYRVNGVNVYGINYDGCLYYEGNVQFCDDRFDYLTGINY